LELVMTVGKLIRWTVVPVVAAILTLAAGEARATSIVLQTSTPAGNRISQQFPDQPTFSSYEFDDFTTSQSFDLTTLTVFGTEGGNSAFNVAVTAEIWSGLPGSGAIVLSATGSQSGADLQFNFGGALLLPGTYWLTAYVTRPVGGGGGQWFWDTSVPVTGSQSFFYNPGGGFARGTTPITGSPFLGAPENQAFSLDGDPVGAAVPEPATLTLIGAGIVAARVRRRRRAN
jgi:hypothetical protein